MSFVQPWMLIAFPLIAIPIIIHLVNQRRFQTVPWAAMQFLLQATKMSSGYTKLRQWLILAMRTLALCALVLFTARPLASGLLGLVGNRGDDVAIVLMDRSPSMQHTQPGSNLTKQEAAMLQLSETLSTLGVQRVVVFDTASEKPLEFSSVKELRDSPSLSSNAVTSNLPELLERSLAYIKTNQIGNVGVWICSDLRESDWRSKDGRWAAAREGFSSLPQDVRFQVLDLSNIGPENLSIHITSVKVVPAASSSQGPELALSFVVERALPSGNSDGESVGAMRAIQVPIEIELASVRSVLNLDLQSERAEVNDHRIPLTMLEKEKKSSAFGDSTEGESNLRGWGVVRIPADVNVADNACYFTFEKPPVRKSIIVSDNPNVIEAIELCTTIAPEQSIRCTTEVIAATQLETVDWDSIGLVIWHDQLPKDRPLELLKQFLSTGGKLLLFPPENPNDGQAFGLQWLGWETVQASKTNAESESDAAVLARVQQWRNDSELLTSTMNGTALPVGQLGIKRICRLQGEGTSLANIQDNIPLLMRMGVDQAEEGDVYVCTTTPSSRDSTLARDGIVMYIAIQRALAAGSQRVSTAKMITAKEPDRSTVAKEVFDQASQEAGEGGAFSNQYSQQAGVYRSGEFLIAQNRSREEDRSERVADETLSGLFGDLKWSRIESGASAKSLVQEIWKWFVIAMIIALIVEAILCIPKKRRTTR